MTDQQRRDLTAALKALGPMASNIPRAVEFGAVRTLTKIVQILAQDALDTPPAVGTGPGIVRHIKGPKVP